MSGAVTDKLHGTSLVVRAILLNGDLTGHDQVKASAWYIFREDHRFGRQQNFLDHDCNSRQMMSGQVSKKVYLAQLRYAFEDLDLLIRSVINSIWQGVAYQAGRNP